MSDRLVLQNPNYSPPTGYRLHATGAVTLAGWYAWHVYNCLSALAGTPWMSGLEQYGVKGCEYRGYSEDGYNPQRSAPPGNIIDIYLSDTAPFDPNAPTGPWGGYHGNDSAGPYAIIPTAGTGLMWVTTIVTHEVAEALTDSPPGGGWVDTALDDENADDCEQNYPLPFVAGGYNYGVAQYWSNRDAACWPRSL